MPSDEAGSSDRWYPLACRYEHRDRPVAEQVEYADWVAWHHDHLLEKKLRAYPSDLPARSLKIIIEGQLQ